MADINTSTWEPRNEADMTNALDVLYEIAIGYVIGELRNENPMCYEKVVTHDRYKAQLVNNIRYSIDTTLSEIVKEYESDNSL